ncbi:MAG: hypothetical protein ACK5L3_09030 [Oscillospiraceae bacterium]
MGWHKNFRHLFKKEKDLSIFKRFVMPALGVARCLFMMVATYFAHGKSILWFLLVFAFAILLGWFFNRKKP